MKLRELFSTMAAIFAVNFKDVLPENELMKISKTWVISNDSKENKKGREIFALERNYKLIKADFLGLKQALNAEYFGLFGESEIIEFYNQINFKKPFGELKASHFANLSALLSLIFKEEANEQTQVVLGLFLTKYYSKFAKNLGTYLSKNSVSNYYQAMGYFLLDFNTILKENLGLKE